MNSELKKFLDGWFLGTLSEGRIVKGIRGLGYHCRIEGRTLFVSEK